MSSIKDQIQRHIKFLSILTNDKEFVTKLEEVLESLGINSIYTTSNPMAKILYYLVPNTEMFPLAHRKYGIIFNSIEDEYTWRKQALIKMCDEIED